MPAADGQIRIPVELGVVVGVQVDGTRRDNQPAGVQHPTAVAGLEPPDLSDLAVLDTNIGAVARNPASVNNRAAFYQCVKLCHDSLLCVGNEKRTPQSK